MSRVSAWASASLVAVTIALATAVGGQKTPPNVAAGPLETVTEAQLQAARELVQRFNDRFRIELTQALRDGGPADAVGAYQSFAPEIASSLSQASQFEITRVAPRVRNPENAPDNWEKEMLERLQKKIAGGADPTKLEIVEIQQTQAGERLLRYMAPIMMREQCLACHGSSISASVRSEISKYYSDDKAIGYSLGEMRGAYSLIQLLE